MDKPEPATAEALPDQKPARKRPAGKAPAETAASTARRKTAVRARPTAATAAAPAEGSPRPETPSPAIPPLRPRKPARQNNLAALTEGVIEALAAAGGADYLLTIARDDPKTFCALLTRILPARGDGKAEGGIRLRWDIETHKGEGR